jgi:muramoyltetrapeptide carboxypeptidase
MTVPRLRPGDRVRFVSPASAPDRDAGVRGVFATRGGKGAHRIAAHLDVESIRADPKRLVGFSDITYLHLALQRAGVAVGFHGPLTNWNDDYYGPLCAEELRRALMDAGPVLVRRRADDYTASLSRGPAATGPLVGGNLDALSRSVGWALPDLTGTIVLMEDGHGTGLGQIDRCLAQLVESGSLDRIATVPLGVPATIDPTAGVLTVTPGVH